MALSLRRITMVPITWKRPAFAFAFIRASPHPAAGLQLEDRNGIGVDCRRRHRDGDMNCENGALAGTSSAEKLKAEIIRDYLDGATPNSAYFALVRWCGSAGAISEGLWAHAHATRSGQDRKNTLLSNLLAQMYRAWGRPGDAARLVLRMRSPNLSSWNIAISACAQAGRDRDALALFSQMTESERDIRPDGFTFVSALSASANLGNPGEGKRIHSHIIAAGLCPRPPVALALANALINMYGKSGRLADALTTFHSIHCPDIISINVMIAAYSKNGEEKAAFQLLLLIQTEGLTPDRFTFAPLLSASASIGALPEGKWIHACSISVAADSHIAVRNAILSMYGKCRRLDDARIVFNRIACRTIISWNAMITALSHNGHCEEAVEVFQNMSLDGLKPDRVTFLAVLDACSSLPSLAQSRAIHDLITLGGFDSDLTIGNALICAYNKCGSASDARSVFDAMPTRNLVTWNAMIAGYAQNGRGGEALKLFWRMELEGVKASSITYLGIIDACVNLETGRAIHEHIVASGLEQDIAVSNALITMFGKCSGLKDAQAVFDRMGTRNVVSWTAVIQAYSHNGYGKEALKLFGQMELEGVCPDMVTFLSVLDACANMGSKEIGREIEKRIAACGIDGNVAVNNALINMYGKCCSLNDARSVFDRMQARDLVTWNSMIAVCAQNGHCEEVLDFLEWMNLEGVRADKITFLSILDACANLSSLEIARGVHKYILAFGYESDVAINNALVNMYSKCGSLMDAQVVFDKMPIWNIISWNTIIGTYAQNGHNCEALKLFRHMFQEGMLPNNITFLSILNACSHAGFLDEGLHYFLSMNNDYGFEPLTEHYACIIDLFGRAGRLDEAEQMILNMPVVPGPIAWSAFLGSCRTYGEMERGRCVVDHLSRFDLKNSSLYFSIANIYAMTGRLDDAVKVRETMEETCGEKREGCS